MKEITVLFFATLRDHMGTRKIIVTLPQDAGIVELKSHLAANVPGSESVLESALVAINREYALSLIHI